MKKIFILAITFLLIITSCSNFNIYKDSIDVCRVGSRYFATLQDAVDYITSSRAINEENTVYVLRDITKKNYSEARRGGITIPSSYTGDLRIDFQGHSYEFSSSINSFYNILGGSNIEIVNGKSIIYSDSISNEKALIVGTRTVKVIGHTIIDLRNSKQAVNVKEGGELILNSATISGDFVLNGNTEIKGGSYEFTSIEGDGEFKIYSGEVTSKHSDTAKIQEAINKVPEEERGVVNQKFIHESLEWKTDEYYHWHECTICHEMVDEKELHDFKNTSSGTVCSICGYVLSSSGDTKPGFDVDVVYPTPEGNLKYDDNTKIVKFVSASKHKEPDTYKWYVNKGIYPPEKAFLKETILPELNINEYPDRFSRPESYIITCEFENENGSGSASITIQNL